jgi:hypothetical protein
MSVCVNGKKSVTLKMALGPNFNTLASWGIYSWGRGPFELALPLRPRLCTTRPALPFANVSQHINVLLQYHNICLNQTRLSSRARVEHRPVLVPTSIQVC